MSAGPLAILRSPVHLEIQGATSARGFYSSRRFLRNVSIASSRREALRPPIAQGRVVPQGNGLVRMTLKMICPPPVGGQSRPGVGFPSIPDSVWLPSYEVRLLGVPPRVHRAASRCETLALPEFRE